MPAEKDHADVVVPPPLALACFGFAQRGRFLWPSAADGVVTISAAQLSYLLSGVDWRTPQKTWRPTAAG